MTVIEARDGAAGFSEAMQQKPDIILLDIILPVEDGLAVLKKLRTAGGLYGKTVPVIMLTNLSADSEVINKAIAEHEPAYYLVKTESTPDIILEKVLERLSRQ
jgi:DNA-binding response OmpR family regulator